MASDSSETWSDLRTREDLDAYDSSLESPAQGSPSVRKALEPFDSADSNECDENLVAKLGAKVSSESSSPNDFSRLAPSLEECVVPLERPILSNVDELNTRRANAMMLACVIGAESPVKKGLMRVLGVEDEGPLGSASRSLVAALPRAEYVASASFSP